MVARGVHEPHGRLDGDVDDVGRRGGVPAGQERIVVPGGRVQQSGVVAASGELLIGLGDDSCGCHGSVHPQGGPDDPDREDGAQDGQ